jgi:N-acetylglucosamine kinase-like BadF-type ATPase
MAHWILGVDGGGTKTTAVLAEFTGRTTQTDEVLPSANDGSSDHTSHGVAWRELGRGEAGGSNLVAVSSEAGLSQIDQAVQQAFDRAALPRQPVAHACLGMAGSDREPVRHQIVAWATTCRLAEHIRIVPDASLLLASIPTSEPAAALIAGTGSLALARDAQGRTARAGGWGPLIGDEGSAYWVARQALQAVVRAADGRRQPTELTAPLLEACCPGRPILDLPAAVADMDRSRLAALAPIVTRTAEAGDSAAAEIVGQAAEHLAEMVWAALQQLELECIPVELVLTGGLLAGSTW